MRIVFLDRNTFAPGIRFPHERLTGSHWIEHDHTVPDEVIERATGAEVMITNKVKLPRAVLQQLPALRMIAVAATGVDHVDLEAAARRGIAVANVVGYATRSVPEHVFGLLLALRRNLFQYQEAVRDRRWSQAPAFCLHDWPIDDLAGSTLGVIGAGQNGKGVARLAEAFGMRVLLAEHRAWAKVRPGRTPFGQVLADADVLTLHVPLNEETRHLIGAEELACMKPNAILINTARGGVVDERALFDALQAGRIAGAGLDVLSVEPPPANHPFLTVSMPNLIMTPHVAWASRQAQQKLADEVVKNIAAYLRGEPRNRVV